MSVQRPISAPAPPQCGRRGLSNRSYAVSPGGFSGVIELAESINNSLCGLDFAWEGEAASAFRVRLLELGAKSRSRLGALNSLSEVRRSRLSALRHAWRSATPVVFEPPYPGMF